MIKLKIYNRIAQFYDILDWPFEYFRYQAVRRKVFDGLEGRLLDAGVGTGRNFPFYPKDSDVTGIDHSDVTGIDLSAAMLQRAQWRKEKLKAEVELHEMNVTQLTFSDDNFDCVVSTFLFCVLDSEHQLPALKELGRICRPDGAIYIVDYTFSKNPFRRFVMRLWAPFISLAYGAAFNRNTEQYLDAAGLKIEKKKFLYKDIIRLLVLRPKGTG
ncbi:class I SAM-dependent methyltransferase [Kiloniella sp.]|uniref:class I SAM-dependent methyltransferase n=1 Tax=Kiloniella sp. TaxID=1938587 RepID=UPI003B01C8D5